MRFALPAAALGVFALSACPTAHTLQTARALGTGKAQVSAELGAQVHPLRDFVTSQPLGDDPVPFETFGNADLTLRYGLGPRTDGFTRFGSSGMELGLKEEWVRAGIVSLATLNSVRSRVDWVTASIGSPGRGEQLQQMVDVTGAVLFEIRAGPASIVLAPKAVASAHFGANGNLFPFLDYGATLGVHLRFGSLVLMPEVAALRPLREQPWVDQSRPAYTGTVSLGWMGDAASDLREHPR